MIHRTRRRDRGDGSYRKRGNTWELRFSAIDPQSGRRVRCQVAFKGTETAARAKLRELLKRADDGEPVVPVRALVSDVLNAWDVALDVSPKTAERYRELVALHIRPHLGSLRLQALRASRIEQFYTDLRDGKNAIAGAEARPLSPRTIGHIHRLVMQILGRAERDGLIASNAARHAKPPKIERVEIEILSQTEVRDVLRKLHGRQPMHRIAALSLATGMRRGEVLALRWKDVEFEAGMLRVEQSLEQTKAGLRFKAPKTAYSRRTISLPPSIVAELRTHRREQLEQRLKFGLGREADDSLVFRRFDGSPLLPNSVTTEWRRLIRMLKLPKVSLHAWRHTHASALIDSGMDVLSISRRLGHGSAAITLAVYGHRFSRKDVAAAAVFESVFAGSLVGTEVDEKSTVAKPIGGS